MDATDKAQLGTQLYTANEALAIDQHATAQLHIPSFKLMQQAGNLSWQYAARHWPRTQTVIVLCGPGNNGGDGWVFAQAAVEDSRNVWVLAAPSKTDASREARAQAAKVLPPEQVLSLGPSNFSYVQEQSQQLYLPMLVVDALFGIGLTQAPREPYGDIIRLMNQMPAMKLALDIPSGINGTTGQALGEYVQAHRTVTFIVPKRGLYRDQGKVASGTVFVEDLRLDASIFQTDTVIRADTCESLNFVPRPDHGHKGLFGSMVCVGGDEGMGGAIIIAAESAVRFGAGKVFVASSTAHNSIAVTRCPSIMSRPLDAMNEIEAILHTTLAEANTLVLGPGLGQSAWSIQCFKACFSAGFEGDIVLDADALNLISTNDEINELVHKSTNTIIMTPHPKEAQRLAKRFNQQESASQSDPFILATRLAQHFRCICLLKGHGTIIACENDAFVCTTGNAALAKAGQGDCLSGMIGALLAQGVPALDAARQGAWAHGLAGESWSKSESALSLLPHETASIAAKAIAQQRVQQIHESNLVEQPLN